MNKGYWGDNLTIGTATAEQVVTISAQDNDAVIKNKYGNGLVITSSNYTSDPLVSVTTSTSSGGYGAVTNTPWPYNQPYTQPPTYYPAPSPTPIIINTPPVTKDELQSPPKDEKVKEGHVLQGTLKIYGDAVVVEYYCSHCDAVIHREVISRVPKSIIEEKCLPRIVKEVR